LGCSGAGGVSVGEQLIIRRRRNKMIRVDIFFIIILSRQET
jgi:hypothetical protein